MPYVFLTGGARSGKSSAAERRASRSASPVTVIATAEARDEEMSDRIAHHRALRPLEWATVEEPVAVAAAVQAVDPDGFIILDCLTLWLANVLDRPPDEVLGAAEAMVAALSRRPGEAVVVSNEVGDGIVPADPTTRRYRDMLGQVNARFAASATEAHLVVAGRFLRLQAPPW